MTQYQELCTDTKLFNCKSSVLATLCKQQGLGYELMFFYPWQFEFHARPDGRIGGAVKRDNTQYESALLQYHGVKINYLAMNDINALKQQVGRHSEDGCAILYDTYWCPWCYNSGKEHQSHYSLVTGFDAENQLHCVDTIPYSEDTVLPVNALFQSKLSIVTAEAAISAPVHGYKEELNQFVFAWIEGGAYERLISYAHLIENKLDLELENVLKGTNSWICTPLLVDLEFIARQKKAFAHAIQYLAEAKNMPFTQLASEMNQLADAWYTLFLSSWKFFLIPDMNSDEAKGYLSGEIVALANKEQALLLALLS